MTHASRLISIVAFIILATVAAMATQPPVFGAPGATGQVTLPDTAAGRAVQQWLAAIRAGDEELLRALHREYSPPEEVEGRVALDIQLGKETGGIDPVSVVRSEEYELVFLGRTRLTELWVEMDVQLSPNPPHMIEGAGIRPAEPPDSVPAGEALSDDALRAQLDRYIARLSDADAFSGTVLIARDGQPIYRGSTGMADRESGLANNTDTKFNLGSMNKMFTAIAIAQLVEQGRLSLDQPVGTYLTDLPPEIAETVTIHHLLTHTSGLGDFFGPAFEEVKDSLRSPRDYFPLFLSKPLRFEPGTVWAYSNGGFILLGAVVEAVSGRDYYDYIREHIYQPAGMGASDTYEKNASVPNLAHGYTTPLPQNPADLRVEDVLGPRADNYGILPRMGSPAGGGYSTVMDLLRFAEALHAGTLVSRETAELFMTGTIDVPIAPNARYGYGFEEQQYRGTRITGHGGGFPGVNSKLDIYRDLGYTVVVLSNIDGGAQPVIAKIRDLLVRG
jgi:CubicO group peptidase (beta-lactamase class C family)